MNGGNPTAGAPSVSPIPQMSIASQPTPGKRGPVGTGPRNNNSTVHTGAPNVSAVGADSKVVPPNNAGMLPQRSALPSPQVPPQVQQIKVSEVHMGSMVARPTVQEMIKAAMVGAVGRAELSAEAERQAENMGEKLASKECEKCGKSPCVCKEKTASYDEVIRLANAVEYIAEEFAKEAFALSGASGSPNPGQGPNALHVMVSPGGASLPDKKGQAVHTVPMSTPLQTSGGGPTTQMQNDHDHRPGGSQTQQTSMRGGSKTASLIRAKLAEDEKLEKKETEGMKEVEKGLEKAEKAHEREKKAASEKKDRKLSGGETAAALLAGGPPGYFGARKARAHGHSALEGGIRGVGGTILGSVAGQAAGMGASKLIKNPTARLAAAVASNLGGQYAGYKALTHSMGKEKGKKKEASLAEVLREAQAKLAEDAINPAQISAGGTVPPDTRAAGESGGASPPGASAVSSNEAATNLTRRDAKAAPKSDMHAYVSEPALSAEHDSVLRAAFNHTSEAGAKIASAMPGAVKTASAKALLSRIAEAQKA